MNLQSAVKHLELLLSATHAASLVGDSPPSLLLLSSGGSSLFLDLFFLARLTFSQLLSRHICLWRFESQYFSDFHLILLAS